MFSKVSVVGLGYIGLPTAAVIALRKIPVIGVDINHKTVEIINEGKIHILEPELDIAVHAAVTQGYLKATTQPEPADVFIIAVPTPFKENHQPNLDYIAAAAKLIAPVLKKGDLVILESTSPVGATEQMADWFADARSDLTFPQNCGVNSDIRIAHCPERVLPGHVLRELVQNDRVIGGMTAQCSKLAVSFYKSFVEGDCIVTDCRTAELCKLTENSFRDVNIAFANELSMICDELDINVWELIKLANRHPRVNILQPGPGVGGHCIAVDPWFIVSSAPEQARLIKTAREVNDAKPDWVINQVQNAITAYLHEHPEKYSRDITIACLGVSFKPDIDDLRESPALEIVRKLTHIHDGLLFVVEPHVTQLPEDIAPKAVLKSLEDGLQEANICLLLVDHKIFKEHDFSFKPHLKIIDTRGIWA